MTTTRRTFLGSAGMMAAAAQAPAKPNLVYVIADQLGYHRCGYAGDEYARTPNMDRLAAEGCNFRQAISNSPVCSAYRASLLTGKHVSSTGMAINELRMSPQHESFGHMLGRGGYRTAFVGKWHMWANQLGSHDLTKNGFVPPGPYRLGFDDVWAGYNFSHSYYGGPYFRDTPRREIWRGYEPEAQTTFTMDFIRGCASRKEAFATFLAWGPPHAPWTWDNVAPEFAEMYRRQALPVRPNFSTKSDPYGDNWAKLGANYEKAVQEDMRIYYAQTASIDLQLGRLMRTLEEAGVADNTILVFSSDHGEMFGSQGRKNKLIFYEEAARIPLLMRWPGRIPVKTVSEALVGVPDMLPTLGRMMGLQAPRTAEGVDLSRHAYGQGGAGPEAVSLQGMGTTAAWEDGAEWRSMRTARHTYAHYRRDGSELLFDNWKDPYQMKNLVDDKSAGTLLREMREKAVAWRREHNDTYEACTWYRDHWTKDRNITQTASGVGHDLEALSRMQAKYSAEAK